jgi:hypothetical protein
MLADLLVELLPTIPRTEAQNKRVESALAECGAYRFEEASDTYREPAVRVTGKSGETYLCFITPTPGCTCPDWSRRGPIGTGDIDLCKHIVGAYVCGQFVHPADPEPAPSPADEDAPEQPSPWWPEELAVQPDEPKDPEPLDWAFPTPEEAAEVDEALSDWEYDLTPAEEDRLLGIGIR